MHSDRVEGARSAVPRCVGLTAWRKLGSALAAAAESPPAIPCLVGEGVCCRLIVSRSVRIWRGPSSSSLRYSPALHMQLVLEVAPAARVASIGAEHNGRQEHDEDQDLAELRESVLAGVDISGEHSE